MYVLLCSGMTGQASNTRGCKNYNNKDEAGKSSLPLLIFVRWLKTQAHFQSLLAAVFLLELQIERGRVGEKWKAALIFVLLRVALTVEDY